MTGLHGCRALCWRVLLGLLSNRNKSDWPSQLQQQVDDYGSLKLIHLPSFDKVRYTLCICIHCNSKHKRSRILVFEGESGPSIGSKYWG